MAMAIRGKFIQNSRSNSTVKTICNLLDSVAELVLKIFRSRQFLKLKDEIKKIFKPIIMAVSAYFDEHPTIKVIISGIFWITMIILTVALPLLLMYGSICIIWAPYIVASVVSSKFGTSWAIIATIPTVAILLLTILITVAMIRYCVHHNNEHKNFK